MGILFLAIIVALAILAGIGTAIEIQFWRRQRAYLSQLDSTMQSLPDPADMNATFRALGLDEGHPFRPALDRILASQSSPEGALDLVEMRHPHERFFRAIRRYATAVLLLCGIAGTLFSLQDALPSSGLATAFDANGQIDSVKYGEAFRKLQPALANAFWPSIFGIVATLALQLARYGSLSPAQDAAGRQFVSVACNWLIPWKVRHEEVATAAGSAAAKFESAATAIFAASKAGADAVRQGADIAAGSLANLGTTLDSVCDRLAQTFDAAFAQILTASSSAIAGVEGCAQHASNSLTELGQALSPVTARMSVAVQCLEKSGDVLRSSALQFDKSLAANGPFLRAIEQLYAAVCPAEARHERLLVSVGELQKLSTTQNVEIARLFAQTTILAKAALQSAEEAKRMTQGVTLIAAGFPSVSQSVKDHEASLTKIAGEWRQAASALASEFVVFRNSIGQIETSHGNTIAALLRDLPSSVASSVAAQLPKELQSLIDTVADSQQRMTSFQQSLTSLESAVDGLRSHLQSLVVGSSASAGAPSGRLRARRKKKWWLLWIR
jgi:hypothetical protein